MIHNSRGALRRMVNFRKNAAKREGGEEEVMISRTAFTRIASEARPKKHDREIAVERWLQPASLPGARSHY